MVMPIGHGQDLGPRPLSAAARWVLALLALALVAAAIALAVSVTSGDRPPPRGCVDVVLPTFGGGAATRRCGADAVRFCRSPGLPGPSTAAGADIRSACARAGY